MLDDIDLVVAYGADIGINARYHHVNYGAAHIAWDTINPLVGGGCQFDLGSLVGAVKLDPVFTTIFLGQAEREYLIFRATMCAVVELLVNPDLGYPENGDFR